MRRLLRGFGTLTIVSLRLYNLSLCVHIAFIDDGRIDRQQCAVCSLYRHSTTGAPCALCDDSSARSVDINNAIRAKVVVIAR